MRALAEPVLHRPSAGSFVTYAREFIGPWAGFAARMSKGRIPVGAILMTGTILMGFAGGVARVAFFAIPVVIVALVAG